MSADVGGATLLSMTESEFAAKRANEGSVVVQHRGRYWRRTRWGLFEPVHLMAKLHAHEATRPRALCWGYRAALASDSLTQVNGSIPVHLLGDIEHYGPGVLSSNRRYHLRRAQKSVRIVRVVRPEPLESEAYDVFLSAQARTKNPYRSIWSRAAFTEAWQRWCSTPAILLAGYVGSRMGGYITGYAIEGTAYIDVVDLATEALSTHISTGLHFEFVRVCQQSKGVHDVVHSPHIPEDYALGVFKEGLGFTVTRIPSRVEVLPIINTILGWRRPFVHYRLTGQVNGAVERATTGRAAATP